MFKRILLIVSFITNFLVLDLHAQSVTNVTSTTANAAYRAGSIISIQVTFSQTVVVTGTPQLTLETGATDAIVNYSGGTGTDTLTFDYTISPTDNSSDLNYVSTNSLSLNGGTITDGVVTSATLTLPGLLAAGSLATNKNVVIDNITQAPSIILPTTGLASTNNFNFSYLLPETPFASSVHLTFTNLSSTVVADLTLSNLTSASFSIDLANIVPSGNIANTTSSSVPDGTYNIQLSYQDALGNPISNSSATSITVDSVTIPLSNSNLSVPVFDANSLSVQLSYTLEETPLAGTANLIFQSASDTITLTLANSLSNSVTINTQNITIDSIITSASQSTIPEGTYSVTLRYQDALGNPFSSITRNSFSTNIPPNVSVTSTASNLTNTSPIPINIVFSETVTGFTSGDITLGNGTISGFTGSGSSYSANIIPTADGSVTVDISSAVASDLAGNANNAATRLTRTYDNTAPGVTINSSSSNNTKDSPIPISIVFSESVIGFTQDDIALGNGTISGFTGSGSSYSANIIPTADGQVTATILASTCTDASLNGNTGGSFSITYNSHLKTLTPPSINISDYSSRFKTKLSGGADANVTVEIFDNNQSIGRTISDNAGSWTLNLTTPLIAGEHSLTAISSDTYTNISTASVAIVLVIGSTPHDFNKDGISEVVLYRTTSKDLSYTIINGKDSSQTTAKFIGKNLKTAIGDYNGNGVAEPAVVTSSKRAGVSWHFADENNKQITSETFGRFGDKILTGCNFSSETKSSMAVVRGNTLIFKTRGENGENQLNLPIQYRSANLRGCGDINSDGLSEIFYLVQDRSSKRRSFNFVALDISSKVIKEYKKTGSFVQAITDNVYGSEVNDILLKDSTKKARYITYDGSNDQKVTTISVSGSRASFLTCVDSANQYVSCLYFTGSGRKLNKFLPVNNTTVDTGRIIQSNLLTSSVNLY